MNVRSILAVIAALTTLSGGSARAADARPWPRAQGNRFELGLDFLSTSASESVDDFENEVSTLGLAIIPSIQFKLLDRIYADIELPFAYGQVTATFDTELFGGEHRTETTGAFIFGNPTLGAHLTRDLSKDLALFVGGTVSIPVLIDPSDSGVAALTSTQNARALYDIHRFLEEHLSFRARGGLETRLRPRLFYRGDLGLTLAIPIDHGNTDLNIEQGNELEYHFDKDYDDFGAGLRLQEVFRLMNGDLLQTALEPFALYEPKKSSLYGRLGLLIALDDPFGFGFDHGKVATLRLAFGVRF